MKNNKLVFIILAIVLGISLVACSQTKDGHITIQTITYETSSGAMFWEEESLGIDHFEVNGNRFIRPPYTIYNLPGNQNYSYTIKAYDAEGIVMASASGQWLVVEGFATPVMVSLVVKHQHTFRDTWSSDESYHWHASSCGHAAVGNKEQHTFDGDVCTVCGYDKHVHSYSTTIITTATCGSGGLIKYTCSCGDTYNETIPATGNHSFDSNDICATCKLHNTTGGYVFYDKGDYTDGWRYLEAAPADLRVVDGVPTVDKTASGYSNGIYRFIFGYFRTADDGSNLYVNGTTTYNAADCTGTAIGTGKTNTQLLVNAMGAETYSKEQGSAKTANYAAKLCDDLTYTVKGVTYSDWFLPSKDELNLMYENCSVIGGFETGSSSHYSYPYYWSSSEYYNSSKSSAWMQYFNSGSQGGDYRYDNLRVRPVRAF